MDEVGGKLFLESDFTECPTMIQIQHSAAKHVLRINPLTSSNKVICHR